MKINKRHNFLMSLEDIAREANRKFPEGKDVWMEVTYRPSNPKVQAEIIFGAGDIDYLRVNYLREGLSQNADDPREFFDDKLLRDRLLEVVDEILKERVSMGSRKKLGYIKSELQGLETRSYSVKRFSKNSCSQKIKEVPKEKKSKTFRDYLADWADAAVHDARYYGW